MMFSCSPGHDTSPNTLDTLRSPLWTVLASDLQLRSVNCDQTDQKLTLQHPMVWDTSIRLEQCPLIPWLGF